MVNDPVENARTIDDMAQFAVGRCSRTVWDKMMHSTRDPRKGDDLLFDELTAKQSAMSEVIEDRELRRAAAP
jgi:hypothetical protein